MNEIEKIKMQKTENTDLNTRTNLRIIDVLEVETIGAEVVIKD